MLFAVSLAVLSVTAAAAPGILAPESVGSKITCLRSGSRRSIANLSLHQNESTEIRGHNGDGKLDTLPSDACVPKYCREHKWCDECDVTTWGNCGNERKIKCERDPTGGASCSFDLEACMNNTSKPAAAVALNQFKKMYDEDHHCVHPICAQKTCHLCGNSSKTTSLAGAMCFEQSETYSFLQATVEIQGEDGERFCVPKECVGESCPECPCVPVVCIDETPTHEPAPGYVGPSKCDVCSD